MKEAAVTSKQTHRVIYNNEKEFYEIKLDNKR